MYKLDKSSGEAAVLGGFFLGGGGGGSITMGMDALNEALELGDIIVKEINDVDDEDIIITASAVGSPASKDGYFSKEQVLRVYELLTHNTKNDIKGIITNENGGCSTTNGWILAAMTGIPLIDAPCNGRAHPTGAMGSMGLSKTENYTSVQAAAGGKPDKSIELVVKGTLTSASKLVRQAAVESGGLVTVLRNPVTAKYVKENAAPKAIKQAVQIGVVFQKFRGHSYKIIEELRKVIDLDVLIEGTVKDLTLCTQGGFDVGKLDISGGNEKCSITFWNEYMTVERNIERLATFPDLIVTIDKNTGDVRSSAEIKDDDEIILIKVPRSEIILGMGMFDEALFKDVEKIIGKKMM